jgi:hypothetical protein
MTSGRESTSPAGPLCEAGAMLESNGESHPGARAWFPAHVLSITRAGIRKDTAAEANPMIEGKRVISVCPAGRRRYMEVLLPYLLNHRGLIDEHHFWVNTLDADDIAWMQARCAECPDYFKLVPCPGEPAGNATVTLFYALPAYRQDNTIIIKIDDDIVFIAPNAIWNLLTFRLENPEFLLVSANVVNNGVCDFLRQRAGLVREGPLIADGKAGGNAWASGPWAEAVHRSFLADLAEGDIATHEQQFRRFVLYPQDRFSINFIAWFGEDMARLHITGDDEHFLSHLAPVQIQRLNVICGSSVVSHYAYFTQREHMDVTDLLERYAEKTGM